MKTNGGLETAFAAGAVAMSLLLGAGTANAAEVRLQGLRTVDLGVQDSFLVSAFIADVGSLANWQNWQLNLDLSGRSGATGAVFDSFSDVTGRSDYIFFGNSGGYIGGIFPNGTVGVAADQTASGGGVAADVDDILAQFTIDVSNAQPGQTYDITLDPAFLNFFEDDVVPNNNKERISQSGSYSFQVVPIPAAAWLLGSGLVALVAVARRRKMTA